MIYECINHSYSLLLLSFSMYVYSYEDLFLTEVFMPSNNNQYFILLISILNAFHWLKINSYVNVNC